MERYGLMVTTMVGLVRGVLVKMSDLIHGLRPGINGVREVRLGMIPHIYILEYYEPVL